MYLPGTYTTAQTKNTGTMSALQGAQNAHPSAQAVSQTTTSVFSSARHAKVKKSVRKQNEKSTNNRFLTIPVEYWISSAGLWTESAILFLNKNKNKLYIDIQDRSSGGPAVNYGNSRCE